MNIALIGYRGCGKTSVARLLAEKIHWGWLDNDAELEARLGRSIASLFETEGEHFFRTHESQLLAELIVRPKTILATGGGVILAPENRALLKSQAVCVWLQAQSNTLAQRLERDAGAVQHRPPLTSAGLLGEIRHLLEARTPLYEQVAEFSLETDRMPPAEVAEVVHSWLITHRPDLFV